MANSKLRKILLLLAGIIGIGVGLAQLLIPVAFEASAGIRLGGNISLLSEIRAAGGTLFFAGSIIISGAFNSRFTYTSIVLSSLFFLGYGLSRLFSMIIDGMPGESLVIATVTEIVVGLVSLFLLIDLHKQQQSNT